MDKLQSDVVQAWRSLRQRRAYALTCIATFALVLGANAAIFAVVSATLLRPLPFTAGERVVQLYMLPPGMFAAFQRNPLQQMDLVRVRARTQTMARVEGYQAAERVLTSSGEPTLVRAAAVTPGLLQMMAVPIVQGRPFTDEDGTPGHPVALVTAAYVQRTGVGAALGSTLTIDGIVFTIVGITGSNFPPAFLTADVFTPLVPDPTPLGRNPLRSVVTLAELAPGATVAQARDEANRIVQETAKELPQTHTGWTAGAQTVREWQFATVRAPILVLFGATSVVLLIACANIASLTSAHAAGRAGDLALRVALGASRIDVVRLHVVELAIVAILGAMPGLLMASAALPMLLSIDPTAARALGVVTVDWRVQLFTFVLAAGTAAACGIVPALQGFRGLSAVTLAGGTRRTAGSAGARRLRRLLVTAEVALCLALLMAGAVLVNSLRETSRIAPGFNPSDILTAQIRLSPTTYPTQEARAQVVSRILERVRSVPGVVAASTTMNDFIPGNAYQTTITVDGRPRPDGQPYSLQFRRVSPEYFEVMQIGVARGRAIVDSDRVGTPEVAVISRLLGEQLFPGEDPIGRTIRRTSANAPPTTIVGVVEDVNDVSLTQRPEPTLYLAWAQNNNAAVPVSFVIRGAVAPESLVPAVRQAVLSVDRSLPLRQIQSLDAFLSESIAPDRFRTTVLGIISALGLTLAGLGIYGVAYRAVIDRSQEIAVRLALGARPSRIVGLLITDAMRDVLAGTVVGLGLGLVLCGLLARAMVNVHGAGFLSAGAAVMVLTAAALVATMVPARRVWRVHPAEALR